MQESVLLVTLIHFFGTETAWECETYCLCECGHVHGSQSFAISAFRDDEMGVTHILKTQAGLSCILRAKGGADHTFSRVTKGAGITSIMAYSARSLTKVTNKLAALPALAQHVMGLI